MAQRMENGNSLFKVPLSTASGVNSAHAPQTTIRLKILEPTALLTASALFPDMDAVTLTASSGRLVPIATIVSPIIIEGTRRRFATEELPSTKKSAPLIKSTNPTTSSTIAINISFIVFPHFL